MKKIAVLVGSLRKNSYSQKLANNLVGLLPEGYEAEFIKIDHLPLYNQDYDTANTPAEYAGFRNEIRDAAGVIFVTPEHNRSYPAALKNALDIGSRPYSQSVWDGKPALVVSQSPGNISGFGANHHLRQALTFLNMPTVQQPEAYIAHTNKLFDDDGNINNEGTLNFLQTVIDAFIEMVELYQETPEQEMMK
ncbi:MAG: NAD(P)H-dependent oxidoreductase [Anaerolineaceae bacterium]|nr:NAD(P)H-dependent oxidoreductase [Anaerolineaceae bacterium]MDD4043623.1 NAD(P)H-dependent oxidoreductase [Anaerolineaceae bacterium]MDD4577254.1 NAD(P)H-dependent oxidoreductase [Anaerolineaceae bacterium]